MILSHGVIGNHMPLVFQFFQCHCLVVGCLLRHEREQLFAAAAHLCFAGNGDEIAACGADIEQQLFHVACQNAARGQLSVQQGGQIQLEDF